MKIPERIANSFLVKTLNLTGEEVEELLAAQINDGIKNLTELRKINE